MIEATMVTCQRQVVTEGEIGRGLKPGAASAMQFFSSRLARLF